MVPVRRCSTACVPSRGQLCVLCEAVRDRVHDCVCSWALVLLLPGRRVPGFVQRVMAALYAL